MTPDQEQEYRLRAGVELFLAGSGDLYLIPPPGREQALIEAPYGTTLARVLGGNQSPAPELVGLLAQLVEEGLVTREPAPVRFDGPLDRQARYLDQYLDDVDEAIEELAAATLLVAGVGGVGTLVAEFAVRAGVGAVILVDDDIVEEANLTRQLFELADVGRPKAATVAERLRRVRPEAHVPSEQVRIDSAEAAHELLGRWRPDLLLLCADTPWQLINRWIDEACWEHGVPWMGGGQELPLAVAGPLVVPGQTSCASCQQAYAVPEGADALHDELARWRHEVGRPIPAMQFADSIIASAMVQTALAFLTGYTDPVLLGRELTVDTHSWQSALHVKEPCVCSHTNRARHARAA